MGEGALLVHLVVRGLACKIVRSIRALTRACLPHCSTALAGASEPRSIVHLDSPLQQQQRLMQALEAAMSPRLLHAANMAQQHPFSPRLPASSRPQLQQVPVGSGGSPRAPGQQQQLRPVKRQRTDGCADASRLQYSSMMMSTEALQPHAHMATQEYAAGPAQGATPMCVPPTLLALGCSVVCAWVGPLMLLALAITHPTSRPCCCWCARRQLHVQQEACGVGIWSPLDGAHCTIHLQEGVKQAPGCGAP